MFSLYFKIDNDSYAKIDGTDSNNFRSETQDLFSKDSKMLFLLLTIKTCGQALEFKCSIEILKLQQVHDPNYSHQVNYWCYGPGQQNNDINIIIIT